MVRSAMSYHTLFLFLASWLAWPASSPDATPSASSAFAEARLPVSIKTRVLSASRPSIYERESSSGGRRSFSALPAECLELSDETNGGVGGPIPDSCSTDRADWDDLTAATQALRRPFAELRLSTGATGRLRC